MPSRTVYNGPVTALNESHHTLPSGADAQDVVAGYLPKVPVAATAAQARFAVSSTTISLTSKAPGAGEEFAMLELVAGQGDVTYWMDGKDPAVTPGHVLGNGQIMLVDNIANFKMVRAATTDATAVVSYWKHGSP